MPIKPELCASVRTEGLAGESAVRPHRAVAQALPDIGIVNRVDDSCVLVLDHLRESGRVDRANTLAADGTS